MALPKWLSRNPRKAETLAERICEDLREIGVLLIALAPLDIGLKDGPNVLQKYWPELVLFVGGGLFLWLLGVIVEWKVRKYDD